MRKLLSLAAFLSLFASHPALATGAFDTPLTGGPCSMVKSGTVGTAAVVEVPAIVPGVKRGFLQIQNPTASGGASIAYTLDGSAPVVNGNGFTLFPGGSATYDTWVPQGAVTIIGSGAGTAFSVCVGP